MDRNLNDRVEFEVVDDDDYEDNSAPAENTAPYSLGDAGASNSDETYTGDVSTSPISLDYFRSRFTQFQTVINAADSAYAASKRLMSLGVLDANTHAALMEQTTFYEQKLGDVRRVAELMNVGAAAANAVGMRMPVLSIPATLGAVQFLAVGAGVIAAVAAAAAIIASLSGMIRNMDGAISGWLAVYTATTPESKAAVARELAVIKASESAADGTGLPSLSALLGGGSSYVKIGLIAVAAFLAFQLFKRSKSDD